LGRLGVAAGLGAGKASSVSHSVGDNGGRFIFL